MKKRQNFSECYFEYQIKCVDNGLNLTEEETPQLYFEKRLFPLYSFFAIQEVSSKKHPFLHLASSLT